VTMSEVASPNFKLDGIPSHLRDPKTNWFKNDFEVTSTLRENNPLLPRSTFLKASSGRYSSDLHVPGGRTTAKNPTGMTETYRRTLPVIKATDLSQVIQSAPPSQLVGFIVVDFSPSIFFQWSSSSSSSSPHSSL
jgi:hypothetical protein